MKKKIKFIFYAIKNIPLIVSFLFLDFFEDFFYNLSKKCQNKKENVEQEAEKRGDAYFNRKI